MKRYRKKPLVIDAVQWNGRDDNARLRDFAGAAVRFYPTQQEPEIPTPEGDMFVSRGDWVIKGVKGEFYPCKPDVFAATYEPAE